MIFGIELNKACLLTLNLSNAPACTRPSSCNLFISLGFTLFIKSDKFLNSPLFNLSFITLDIASNPTFLIALKHNKNFYRQKKIWI